MQRLGKATLWEPFVVSLSNHERNSIDSLPFDKLRANGLLIVFLSTFFLARLASADVLYYRSGETEKGLVVEEHPDRIIFKVELEEKTVLRTDLDEVFYDDPERNNLYLGNQAFEARDFGAARGFFRKALQMNPQFQEAEDALHHLEDWQKKWTPSEDVDPVAALDSRWGLAVARGPDYPVVRVVREGSRTSRWGIVSGDLLVSVWGSSLAYRLLKEVAHELWGPPESPMKLTIRRAVFCPQNASHWPGMQLDMRRLGLTVVSVEPGGAAQQSGIQAQDRIVAVNSRPTRYLPLAQAHKTIQQAHRKGINLLIERDLMIRRE